MEIDDFDTSYDSAIIPIYSFGPIAEDLIRRLLKDRVQFHSISHRIKSKPSTRQKLITGASKYTGIQALTDLLGVRIITYYSDEVDAVATIVEKEFSVDKKNSVDKRALLDPDRFGYLSLHYIVQLRKDRSQLAEYASFSELKFEIQIRSILQHAWAEIEHDLGYKSEAAIPRDIQRRFSRLAGLLEVADDEFYGFAEIGQSIVHKFNRN
jgi:putative GTP pyrophosphokinase